MAVVILYTLYVVLSLVIGITYMSRGTRSSPLTGGQAAAVALLLFVWPVILLVTLGSIWPVILVLLWCTFQAGRVVTETALYGEARYTIWETVLSVVIYTVAIIGMFQAVS